MRIALGLFFIALGTLVFISLFLILFGSPNKVNAEWQLVVLTAFINTTLGLLFLSLGYGVMRRADWSKWLYLAIITCWYFYVYFCLLTNFGSPLIVAYASTEMLQIVAMVVIPLALIPFLWRNTRKHSHRT